MKSPKLAVGSLTFLLVVLGMTSLAWSDFKTYSTFNESLRSENMFTIFILNKDQFQGSWKQFKGELKEEWGQFTDDDLLEIEGDMDKFEGKLQERYGDRKEELREWTDRWFERQTFESQSRPINP
ncbi:CsbD family protein [Candidatus Nitrospira salsa]